MAIDEALLESVAAGASPPTLRLYAWEPPCLSLGYAQPISDVDEEEVVRRGWDLVRRPSGGRAILHTDELTYSITAKQGDALVSGDVLESYRHLARGLIEGLQCLGVEAEAHALAAKAGDKGPVCFDVPSNYEITTQGRKLLGSAQSRRLGAILQHGSLPLRGDMGRIVEVLRQPGGSRLEAMERVRRRAITLQEALGHGVDWERVALSLMEGFSFALQIDLRRAGLTSEEHARACELSREKYANPSWTARQERFARTP